MVSFNSIRSSSATGGQQSYSTRLNTALSSSSPVQRLNALIHCVQRLNDGLPLQKDTFASALSSSKSDSTEAKRLVGYLIEHMSALYPDQSLLPISSLQNQMSLSDARPVAIALQTLASIQVSQVVPVIFNAISTCARHTSPWVRKASVHALLTVLPRLSLGDPDKHQLHALVAQFLSDTHIAVFNSAIILVYQIGGDVVVPLLHPVFRRMCNLLPSLNLTSQALALTLLTHYGRTQFERLPDDMLSSDSSIQSDFALMLRSSARLIHSSSTAVALAASTLWIELGPRNEVSRLLPRSLVWRLNGQCPAADYALINSLKALCKLRPEVFESSVPRFFCFCSEPLYLRRCKLDMLIELASSKTLPRIIGALQEYVRDPEAQFACLAVQALAQCGLRVHDAADECMQVILKCFSRPSLRAVCALSIRSLLEIWEGNRKLVLQKLVRHLEVLEGPGATAAQSEIVWMLGRYRHDVSLIVPDVLRKMLRRFGDLDSAVKLQILTLAAKLAVDDAEHCEALAQHAFQLGKYDRECDVRDRVRALIVASTGGSPVSDILQKALVTAETTTSTLPASKNNIGVPTSTFTIGSLSHLVGFIAGTNFLSLPEFAERASDDHVRGPVGPESSAHEPELTAALPNSCDGNDSWGDDDSDIESPLETLQDLQKHVDLDCSVGEATDTSEDNEFDDLGF